MSATNNIPPPPTPTGPMISDATLKYEQNFQVANFQYFAYKLSNFGMTNYISGVEPGGSQAWIENHSDGQKSLGLRWNSRAGGTDRAALGMHVYEIGLSRRFLMEFYSYIPAFALTDPNDAWYAHNEIASMSGFVPKWQIMFLGHSNTRPKIPQGEYRVAIDYRTPSSYGYITPTEDNDGITPSTPINIPMGTWFKTSMAMDFDLGQVVVGINDATIFNVLQTPTPTLPVGANFFVSPAKIYAGSGEALPKELWTANIRLYDLGSTPAPETVTINFQTGPNGTIAPIGTQVFNVGTVFNMAATPNAGYVLDEWRQDGRLLPDDRLTIPIEAGPWLDGATFTVTFKQGAAPQPTYAARTIGPLGVPTALLHQMWRLRERYIRPEVHKKLHPVV